MRITLSCNGPMTSFMLRSSDEQVWYLCREDLANLANGVFEFEDCRKSIDLDDSVKNEISKQAVHRLQDIADKKFMADLGGGYHSDFCENEGKFGQLTEADLGKRFMFKDRPYVFLGALKRARIYKLAAENLVTGTCYKFTVPLIELLLHGDPTSDRLHSVQVCQEEEQ
jgi:hypothetical protein